MSMFSDPLERTNPYLHYKRQYLVSSAWFTGRIRRSTEITSSSRLKSPLIIAHDVNIT